MSRLATTAIGGLAALTALLLLRARRKTAQTEQRDVIVIHSEPRYDTPALRRPEHAGHMIVMPLGPF